ncbi:bile acid:sodium symporter family protein [Sandaracinus amylolyticus]|uniref:Putative sodium dependent transporter n=1 Tax=Sandaracinus amylolyticus TaxID=927083 RepID=A0A0F6SDQ4_9BACT|nr:bile acid:sodium symporter [Sandaracinus amylolyticus]AKF03849.1 putative sodium dependent transporter [Sandaracinus amylolyticus]
MDLQHAFALSLKIAIAAMTVATGLATSTGDLAYLARRRGLLARSLLATVVIAPLIAIALCRALPVGTAGSIAIIAGALAPGMPSVPRTGGKLGGNAAYGCSLLVVTSALGVLTVPLWLSVVGRVVGTTPDVPPLAIARTLALGILVPLGVGLAIRRLAPSLADRLVKPVGALATALLPGLALVLLLVEVHVLRQLEWPVLVAMAAAPVIALAVGHALGGPDPRDRTVLAIANATRFPALAALIATTSFPRVPAMPVVIAYLLIALAIALPYELWRKRVHGRAETERPERLPTGVLAGEPAA